MKARKLVNSFTILSAITFLQLSSIQSAYGVITSSSWVFEAPGGLLDVYNDFHVTIQTDTDTAIKNSSVTYCLGSAPNPPVGTILSLDYSNCLITSGTKVTLSVTALEDEENDLIPTNTMFTKNRVPQKPLIPLPGYDIFELPHLSKLQLNIINPSTETVNISSIGYNFLRDNVPFNELIPFVSNDFTLIPGIFTINPNEKISFLIDDKFSERFVSFEWISEGQDTNITVQQAVEHERSIPEPNSATSILALCTIAIASAFKHKLKISKSKLSARKILLKTAQSSHID